MRKLLFKNFGLKILSLALAITLWFFISARGVSEITLEVPIEYMNIPPGYEILKKDTDTVRVSLFGSEGVLRSIRPEDLRVYVDLKEARPGKGTFTIKKSNVKVPPVLTISNIRPSKVNIILDKTARKDVPVKPNLIGKPAAKIHISQVIIKPEKVEIEGPESVIKKVSHVSTEPINISGISRSITETVNIVSDASAARLKTDRVVVYITVKEGKGK